MLLQNDAEAVVMAELMPAHWAAWLRNAPPEQLRPFNAPNPMPARGMWY